MQLGGGMRPLVTLTFRESSPVESMSRIDQSGLPSHSNQLSDEQGSLGLSIGKNDSSPVERSRLTPLLPVVVVIEMIIAKVFGSVAACVS